MVDKVSVMEEGWDHLIILDACRYDYFSKVYRDYLRGKLKKAISLGSDTVEWCKKSFRKRYNDVVYISANPIVNSKVEVEGFTARKHFHRVVDVWDRGWDEKLGTVHPKEVNKATQKLKDDYPHKRFIIHYLQPHYPYLVYKLRTPRGRPKISHGRILRSPAQPPLSVRARMKLLHACVYLAKHTTSWQIPTTSWKIRGLLNLPPASPMDAVRRRIGESGLRQLYKDNLRLVLQYVASLVEDLSGVIIITADHGERLGEGGAYSHRAGLSDPLLLEVPWFKVEKVVRTKKHHKENEKKRIKRRIKELKALGEL